jgi:predicted ATP-grasp superfamily ATP-dependent carboligase
VAAVRAFGQAGLRPIVAAPTGSAAGLWSRYRSGRIVGADPVARPEDFVRLIGSIAEGGADVVIYPGQEESLDALLAHSDLLPPSAQLPYPGAAEVDQLRNKATMKRHAETVGFRPPATLFDGTAAGLLAAELDPPYVVKPLAKASEIAMTTIVESRRALETLLRDVPGHERVIAEERVIGQLIAVSLVLDRDGRVVAQFQQRSRRTWPADAGPSSVAVSTAPDPELIERSAALLVDAGFWGLAQIQYLAGQDGVRGPIDVNPRFFGSLPLALAAGANLPVAWHAVATGAPVDGPAPYREGVTYRWLEADVLAAIHGMPRYLLERQAHPKTGAMWSGDDPLPGVVLATAAATGWFARQLPRARGLTAGRHA